jgi:MoxR-like ATPase
MSKIRGQVERVFVGQRELVDLVLVAFVSSGHVLIEGHPGLGKTHLVLSLAETFQGLFKRIQFTPDLMPSDITGHSMYDLEKRAFEMKQGPVFTNLLLADEVNRAPAKTQSALLEVMQERQATIDGTSYPMPVPFMVLATQNPVEQDGTYPLPEAQLDRFMMKLLVKEPPPRGGNRHRHPGHRAGRAFAGGRANRNRLHSAGCRAVAGVAARCDHFRLRDALCGGAGASDPQLGDDVLWCEPPRQYCAGAGREGICLAEWARIRGSG